MLLRGRSCLVGVLLACGCAVVVLHAQTSAPQSSAAAPAAPRTNLTDEQIEAFLASAQIVRKRGVSTGVTGTTRATLSDGTLTHDAQIQTVDVYSTVFEAGKATEIGFRDSYKFNVAGYRLSRLLGMDNVPVSIDRVIDRKPSAVTWWIDDVKMDEKARLATKAESPAPQRTARLLLVMRVFDELIQNRDRNQGNILWTGDWQLWLIDHTRAFRMGRDLLKPDQLRRIDVGLLAHLRGLTLEKLDELLVKDGTLTKDQTAALLARRDRLVAHFEKRIAEVGEAAVLFSLD
jgi:hypothetical protein